MSDLGAQWPSGRVLDSRPKGRGFEPHRHHCVVSLSKNINPSLVLVQPRNTHPYICERLLIGQKKIKSNKQTNKRLICSFVHCIGLKPYTVKPVLRGDSKRDETKVLKANGSSLKEVEAECSNRAFCSTFDLH